MDHEIDVKAIREALGLTQVQLAAEIGVDQGTVSKWENGAQPRGPAVILLQSLLRQNSTPERAS